MNREEIEALAQRCIDECDGTDDDGLACFSGVHAQLHLADWLWNAYTAGLERAAEIAEGLVKSHQQAAERHWFNENDEDGGSRARAALAVRDAALAIRSEKHQD